MTIEEDQARAFYDEEDRKARIDYMYGWRKTPLSNNILLMLGRLLPPETEFFPHINRDMSTSNVDIFDKIRVLNDSELINFCDMYQIKRSKHIAFNRMITILTVDKSLNGWWGDLFTTTVTKKSEEFKDQSPKKTGWLPFMRGGAKND